MVYVVGIIGFVGGFVLGQVLLGYLLSGKTREELMNDSSLKWKYGTLNWVIAVLGAISFISVYKHYLTMGS